MTVHAAAYGLTRKRLGLHLAAPPPPLSENRPSVDPDTLESELARVAGGRVEPAAIALFPGGDDAWAALRQTIDSADHRLDVLMYLWGNDPIGWGVAKHLAARAGPTLPVRVLIDGGGNLLQGRPKNDSAGEVNAPACWLARQPHVQVIRTRNPFFRYDHRKLVIADGRRVWSGGRNFTSDAFLKSHDLSYTLSGRLTGELAGQYEEFWQEQGGAPAGRPLPLPPPADPSGVNAVARLVRTQPYESNLARTVYTAVSRARHHVYVANPYLTDARMLVELARARQRGADVRVILTLESGSKATDLSNRVTANRLLRAGVRVYLYPGLLHVKATAVDGVWAYLGTGNFDPLSLRHNRELGLAVSHGTLVRELEERLFQPDFRPEWELHDPLPVTGYQYLVEAFANLFF
jgi:cardiolipin synthase